MTEDGSVYAFISEGYEPSGEPTPPEWVKLPSIPEPSNEEEE